MAESPGSDYDFQRRGRRYLMPLMRPNSSSLLASLLEYSGLLRDQRHRYFGVEPRSPLSSNPDNTDRDETAVSIWIIRGEGGEGGRENNERYASEVEQYSPLTPTAAASSNIVSSSSVSVNDNGDGNNNDSREEPEVVGTGRRARVGTASLQYNALQLAQWIEQGLPFTILLLIVFIRQHLQGFIVVLWVSAVMYKANNLIRKQTPIKSERKTIVLLAIVSVLIAHVTGVYWWYRKQNLFRSLFILPPKDIPKFWEALFIIIVNDTMVRQIAMVVKSGILICYKNSKGRAYRRQAQLLTLIEYTLILYRALLPVPVWYRFFLNKLYGNLLSSLSTGLYLTFKLMATLEKVQSFFSAVVAFSQMEVQYGSCATSEEVLVAGDWCAICQEKMHAPISLRCKHIFCEDCVSEWFERERTCPLCRAVVESAGLRSFGDGSTSLFVQIF